jgi:uncharacterized membrane protein YkoI
MVFFFKATLLVMLLNVSFVAAEKKTIDESSKETKLPEPPSLDVSQAVTLDEAIKQIVQDPKNKVLAAKTEVIEGKKIHVIKVLTTIGHIQYIKIDATTGKTLDKDKK